MIFLDIWQLIEMYNLLHEVILELDIYTLAS